MKLIKGKTVQENKFNTHTCNPNTTLSYISANGEPMYKNLRDLALS